MSCAGAGLELRALLASRCIPLSSCSAVAGAAATASGRVRPLSVNPHLPSSPCRCFQTPHVAIIAVSVAISLLALFMVGVGGKEWLCDLPEGSSPLQRDVELRTLKQQGAGECH